MEGGFYYVYALKDPRKSPALPFYIGKGTGSRSAQHLLKLDDSPKGARIRSIRADRAEPLVEALVEDLTEAQALRIEAELIAAFGTQPTGGLLTNQVVPRGTERKTRASLIRPTGALERAQVGLTLLKDAIMALARANPTGVSNSDVTNALGLQSDYQGGHFNYLGYSVLGLLMREGVLVRVGSGMAARHVVAGTAGSKSA